MYSNDLFTQCQSGLQRYEIIPGDTLYKIAKRFNTTVKAILTANPMVNPQSLSVGENIYIPLPGVYPVSNLGIYYVAAGGTSLYGISQMFNICLSSLLEVNPGINPNQILKNNLVCIPVGAPAEYCTGGMTLYNVQYGDNFQRLSQKFDMSLEEFINANPNINPEVLYLGQNICIPIRWNLFFSELLNVSFRYPSSWMKIRTKSKELERYEGEDGFFEASAIPRSRDKAVDIKSVADLCLEYAYDRFYAFGYVPSIEKAKIDGQEGGYIHPSEGQPYELRGMAALIVKYPKLIFLSGAPHAYIIIYSDEEYIKRIGDTLKFIKG